MNFTQAFKMAAKSISANKGRSALTMLGVIIGLAAVIILVSYAQGQNMAMRAYYESMGTNTITVSASSYRGNVDIGGALYDYCLQLDDLVVGVSPTGYLYSDPTIKFGSKTISRQWQSMGGGAMMSTGQYPNLILGNDKYGLCNDYVIAKGRDLSYLDVEKESKVCVLGSAVAEFLAAHPKVASVSYCGLPGDKYHALAEKYLPHGSCGVVSFELKGGREAAGTFMKHLKLAAIETHVADARTCCLNPASSTHRQMTDKQLAAAGIPAGLVRMSCGLEHKQDLIDDIAQALEQVK